VKEMADDFIKEEQIEEHGKVKVRTRIIDVDRDKNNFIVGLDSMSALLEQKIKEGIVDSGEAPSLEEVSTRVVLTVDLPSTAKQFPEGIEAFRHMRLRCAIKTPRASATVVTLRENYMGEKDDEIKQKLNLSVVPFKDNKSVMEARISDGAVLLEFRPIAHLTSSTFISLKKNYGGGWDGVVEFLAEQVLDEFKKHMGVYDLVCVFRSVAFESVVDIMEN
jgi:hypothetical protein